MQTITTRPAAIASAVTLAGTAGLITLDHGGFTGGAQKLLLALTALGLAELVVLMPDAVAGAPGAAVRWGLVIVAYGAAAITGRTCLTA